MQAHEGLLVLDLSDGVAGDYCARLFGDFGADVVKVEPPGGSPLRQEGPFCGETADPERSLLFWNLNTNKRSVVLDCGGPTGAELLAALADKADVIVQTADLDHAALRRRNPGLITCQITGFSGGWAGSEMLYHAAGASMVLNAGPGREPLYGFGHRSEYQAGVYGYFAAAVALFARLGTGEGQHVSVDITESVISQLQCSTTVFEYSGHVDGPGDGSAPPRAVLPARGGHISMYIPQNRWQQFVAFTGDERLADSRFATGAARLANVDELNAMLREWAADKDAAAIEAEAQRQKLPVTRVLGPRELATDEHLAARGYYQHLEDPELGPLTFLGPIFRAGASPWQLRRRPPRLGEHTAEVLSGLLGLPAGEIAAIISEGT